MQILNMPRRLFVLLGLVCLIGSGVIGTASIAVGQQSPVLVGAGDIAACDEPGDEATALLLDAIPGTVYTTGDNAYPYGRLVDYQNCYHPSWGRHKDRTRPSVGNHEYDANQNNAEGYFAYYGAAAGPAPQGYYSYNLGTWHIVVLNSECGQVSGGCGANSPQIQWLRADLAANPRSCVLAYWHRPLFTSSNLGNYEQMQPAWQALYDAGADVVLNGHAHNYERFAPQDPQGRADPRGIREFIVGTGGEELVRIQQVTANSQVRNDNTFGVLKLTLHSTSYDWQFVPIAGQTFSDSGSGSCTGSTTPPTVTATATTQPTATATTTPPGPQRRQVYLPLVRR